MGRVLLGGALVHSLVACALGSFAQHGHSRGCVVQPTHARQEPASLLQRTASSSLDLSSAEEFRQEQQRELGEVWKQLKAASLSEDLHAAIEKAAETEGGQRLQDQLNKLNEAFPWVEEVKTNFAKKGFREKWKLIRIAISTDELKRKLEVAAKEAAPNGEEAANLREQIAVLGVALSKVRFEDLQAQAAANWAGLMKAGVPLPPLADATSDAQKVLDEVTDAALSAVFTSVSDAAQEKLAGVAGNLERRLSAQAALAWNATYASVHELLR